MAIDTERFSRFLEAVASEIDIPPGKYKEAVERYTAVARWLEEGRYPGASGKPRIFTQGSFRLGTVVRPIRDGVEADYDIDLVEELLIGKGSTTPQAVKTMVGDRLREHETYRRLLDAEGRRCWTLEYSEQDGVGFHLDVLPAVPDPPSPTNSAISITDKGLAGYSWSASDPNGYANWFEGIHARAILVQKQAIFRSAPSHYASVERVPNHEVRTPLQRAVQLLKRHRDMYFSDPKRSPYAPISIIVTTLAAQLYDNDRDLLSTLSAIATTLLDYSPLLDGQSLPPSLSIAGLIRREADGTWYIGNPVNPDENFADRWHLDNQARARAFFGWIRILKHDLVEVFGDTSRQVVEERLSKSMGSRAVSGHVDLLFPARHVVTAPQVSISSPAKPWRRE